MNHANQIDELPRQRERVLPFVTGPPPSTGRLHLKISPEPLATTIIFADAAGCSRLIVAELCRLGRRSVLVRCPLEAIVLLEKPGIAIDAAFMPLQDVDSGIVQFFDFLQNEHPGVRRIAFARHQADYANRQALQSCVHDMILWDPWERDDFAGALKDALNCRPSPTESSWSDTRLFRSRRGADRSAIGAIVQRYRHRISHLVSDATADATDAEDIVQDAYLGIVRLLPSFDGECSPGEWIDRVTRDCVRSFLRRSSIGNIFSRRSIARDPYRLFDIRTNESACA